MNERIRNEYFLHINHLSSKLKGYEFLDFQLDEVSSLRTTSREGQDVLDLGPLADER
jgi:hypothetical protein